MRGEDGGRAERRGRWETLSHAISMQALSVNSAQDDIPQPLSESGICVASYTTGVICRKHQWVRGQLQLKRPASRDMYCARDDVVAENIDAGYLLAKLCLTPYSHPYLSTTATSI
jgi:hypothetical protein